MAKPLVDRRGMVFGELTILRRDEERSTPGNEYVLVRCSCGTEKSSRYESLRSGATKTCGCGKKYHSLKHGHGRIGERSPEYLSWSTMVQRCTNPLATAYHRYGGRGIQVCQAWLNFENFFSDTGPRPDGTSLERKDGDGHYEKNNCVWLVKTEQMNNTCRTHRISFRDTVMTLKDLSRSTGIPHQRLYSRIVKLGWPVDRAVEGVSPC